MCFPALRFSLFVLAVATGCASSGATTETGAKPAPRPFLSPVFGDHMVQQRGKPNTFWGWTTPGEKVRVEINGHSGVSAADADGRWQTQVEPPAVGEECVVRIDGPEHVVLHDAIVGDVWLCGGQSNMQIGLPGVKDGAAEVAAATHPKIRMFTVTPRSAYGVVSTPVGMWKNCTPQTVAENGGFSAVAYFFATRVQQETGAPIGVIQDCLGGSPAESWMRSTTLAGMMDFARPMAEVERLRKAHAPEYGNYIMHWYDEYDAGIRGKSWADPDFDDHAWKTVILSGAFESLGLAEGPAVVWFRREIQLPDPLPPGDVYLSLGVVEKMDTAYINGKWVGASSWVENPRLYRIASGVLKPGRNLVALRVFKLKSKAGFLSPPEKIHLVLPDKKEIPLAGEWKAELSVDARAPHVLPLGYENYPTMPSVLFNGMIQPLAPLALTGAIWYQGEANAVRAYQYRTLLPAMIRDWRQAFGQGDFPFFIVSLPAFQARKAQPGTDDWAELRDAQAFAAQTVPNSGLAVTVDTGEADNIHPKDKKPVGERLALLALASHYGKEVNFSGPAYRSIERVGQAIRIHFDHTEGGLRSSAEKLEEFSVAGSDRQWHWADAKIEGDTVIVTSTEVKEPREVRYAWQANPRATLFNGAGLPAGPFRSDDWPGVTDKRDPW